MKKISLVLLLMLLLVPVSVFALAGYYDSVKIDTSFLTDVDIKSVGNIIVEVSDADNNSYEFELAPGNSYTTTVTELFTYSDLKATATFENKKYTGTCTINYDDDKNPVINVTVENAPGVEPAKPEEGYSEEEIEAAKKKVAAKKTRYTIYKFMFGIILGIILGVLCIAGIKIVNANK